MTGLPVSCIIRLSPAMPGTAPGRQGNPGMFVNTAKLIPACVLAAALSACANGSGLSDEEALRQRGAVRLDGNQVKQRVSGKTVQWTRGGGYYMADGKLRARWRKAYSIGSWEVSSNGQLCYQLPKWERRCQVFMDLDGEILLLDDGRNIGAMPVYDGDKLSSLGSFNTPEDRRR